MKTNKQTKNPWNILYLVTMMPEIIRHHTLIQTLNSTLYYYEQKMSEELSKHVFSFSKVSFIFFSSLHICFYPDLLPKNLKLLTKSVTDIP